MSKRKLQGEDTTNMLCTKCECVLLGAYATDGKSRLCNECYKPGRPGFELKILQLDPDAIFLQWVCPQLGADLSESSAFAGGVAASHIEQFLCLLFSVRRVTNPVQLAKYELSEVLAPLGFRSGVVIDGMRLGKSVINLEKRQCAGGDIMCFLAFVTGDIWSFVYFVMSPGSDLKPIPGMPINTNYNVKKPGNKHFLVL